MSAPGPGPGPQAFLYRLASAFSLAHVASGLTTIFVYEVEEAKDSQFIAILYALVTFYCVYAVIPHTTQRDADPVSRLNKQFVIVNFLLLCWVLSIGLVPLTVRAGISPVLAHCAAARFFTPQCLTLGLDMSLPFALVGTLGLLSYSIYRTAGSIHIYLPAPPARGSPHYALAPSHAPSRPTRASTPAAPAPAPEPAKRPILRGGADLYIRKHNYARVISASVLRVPVSRLSCCAAIYVAVVPPIYLAIVTIAMPPGSPCVLIVSALARE
ncbi:hypothetical protein K438DRAFT_1965179 [Mycena galopus ATCC 62051]|nr:hypothetical protein K438DRAFT_1965179 [Mycena galopus ATCC 62051]